MHKMKKIVLVIALIATGLTSFANLTGNGYYRVKNYGSSRWANLIDNHSSIDYFAGSADLHSLELNKDTEAILSDPGSIVLITNVGSNQYDVAAQGTSLNDLVNHPINIRANGKAPEGSDLYMLYGVYKGVTKWIGDGNITNNNIGKASINVSLEDNRKWYIIPVSASSDNYFGVKPNVKTSNNELYTTTFTSFAFKPYSANVKAYYVGRVGYGMVELIEVTDAVPAASPVIIKCAGENVADNKMELMQNQEALPNNALTGVYFDFQNELYTNQVPYDPNTMRVLGLTQDGSLGFIKATDLQVIPGNSAYLKVTNDTYPELKCVSTAEYDANLPKAPEGFYFGNDEYYELYPQGGDNYTGSFNLPKPEDGQPSDLKLRFMMGNTDNYIGAYKAGNKDVVLNYETSQTLPFDYNSPYYWILPDWFGGDLSVTINLENQYIKFYSVVAGIDNVFVGNQNIIFDGSKLYYPGNEIINVYDTSGKLIVKSNSDSLDISHLQKGIYIVKAGNETLKIAL